ncbi:glycosyl transferase family 2 [Riemerella columbina]|uniref:glycosyl transferase family 2 n=1 Tax=Riemerella columbina TaxID=103810 RepID=UPI00266F756F|nr:glycosyl transferase family 2 [Riemerella columbina]WKS95140.1 glycosyltransferase [Riemerella columbina]
MMDVFIKSFNRAYYLDRAIYSLKKYLVGEYQITVLDDGTPQRYLDKIKEKYPEVEIKANESAARKSKAIRENIEKGTEINGFIIPTKLWKEAVKNASSYFIMTEDDVWLTEEVDLSKSESIMISHKSVLLKIGWISQRKINAKLHSLSQDIETIEPRFYVGPRALMKALFENKLKLYSLLRRLKVVTSETFNDYWVMNSLLMGVYRKDYWLYLWNGIEGRVDEQMQLLNATQWYRKYKNNLHNYSKFKKLKMNTTFISSATNSYHKYKVDCDINYFNYIMNEAWYAGEFDSLKNFPKDIPEDYYIQFLEKNYSERCTPENWKKWASYFKEQYRRQEVDVD